MPTVNPMRTATVVDEYDDHEAVRTYLDRYWSWYMTEFEKKCRILGARREKSLLDPTSDWSQRVLAEWEQADVEVRERLACGLGEFDRSIRERVLEAIRDGTVEVNRCPRCGRVVRTPLARQCLACGFDWHS
jgi:hypothetical protein